MRTYLLILLSICALSIVAVVALQPDPATRLEAEISHLPEETALALLEDSAVYDPQEKNITLVHARLLLDAGMLEKSHDHYKKLALAFPDDAQMQVSLAKIELLSGDHSDALRHLQAAYELDPTAERRERIAAFSRIDRDADAEMAILSSVRPERLSSWEADRLATLMMQAKRFEELEGFLRQSADADTDFASSAKERLIVFLIDDDRHQEALEAAFDWYRQSKFNPKLFAELVPVFIQRGAISQARLISDQAMKFSPQSAYLAVQMFSRSGHRMIAEHFQERILSSTNEISPQEWESLIEFAASTGDLRGLQVALAKAHSIPTPLLSEALTQFLRYRGSRALVPYREMMTKDVVQHSPLLASAFAIEHGYYDETLVHLKAAAEMELTEWDRVIWISLARRLKGTGYMRKLASTGVASPELDRALRGEFTVASE